MREALNAFAIRGVSTNLSFHAALMQHPRFAAGQFDTGFIVEQYPQGFRAADVVHRAPLLLAAVAAFARLRYVERAVRTTGGLAGHERKVGGTWVVLLGRDRYLLEQEPVAGGTVVRCGGERHELKSDWKIGEPFLRGTWDGVPVTLQIER